jgi:hypothetical protein
MKFLILCVCFLFSDKSKTLIIGGKTHGSDETTTRAMWCLKILRTKANGLISLILSMTKKNNNNFMIYVFLWNICKIPFDMATTRPLPNHHSNIIWYATALRLNSHTVPGSVIFFFIFPKIQNWKWRPDFYLPIFFVYSFSRETHFCEMHTHATPKWNRNLLIWFFFFVHCFSVNGVYAL